MVLRFIHDSFVKAERTFVPDEYYITRKTAFPLTFASSPNIWDNQDNKDNK